MRKLFLNAYNSWLVDRCIGLSNLYLSTDMKEIIYPITLGGFIGIIIYNLSKLSVIKMPIVEVEECEQTGKLWAYYVTCFINSLVN
jgi:hypothetical protein